jgi:hypothetical protein
MEFEGRKQGPVTERSPEGLEKGCGRCEGEGGGLTVAKGDALTDAGDQVTTRKRSPVVVCRHSIANLF